MVPNRSRCQIDSFTLLVPNWLRCQIGTSAKLTPFTLLVPNWFRCQIDSFYTLGAKLTLLHSWCQIGSGAKLTLLHSWCQIGPVPNWLRCQIDSGAKLVPVPNCPLIFTNVCECVYKNILFVPRVLYIDICVHCLKNWQLSQCRETHYSSAITALKCCHCLDNLPA